LSGDSKLKTRQMPCVLAEYTLLAKADRLDIAISIEDGKRSAIK
jgi:hypothetical protein